MEFYEYTPKLRLTAEKVLVCLALLFAAATFCLSQIPGAPYPAIFQLVTVVFLAVAFVIANKSLLRGYTYTVTEPDDCGERDLLITEHYGKKHTAVCRVSTEQILAVRAVTARDKHTIREMEDRANVIYRYLTPLFPREFLLLTLQTGDAVTVLRLPYEKGLEQVLSSFQ